VLLARDRKWTKPLRFAAAVDVSDPDTEDVARSILHTAGFLAMGLHGSLDILYSEQEMYDETLRMERAVKLAQLVREFHAGSERIQVLSGDPVKSLLPLVAARQYDVLVLGARSRRPLRSSITGGTAGQLIEASSGDVVLVKVPERAELRLPPARPDSRFQQIPDQCEQFV
ncbi:MAG TPA: universal stress protein, partial [Steroidobacteraceae bacterium]|nr:universal stress protein [Steroidobacteraceae bacterium]